MDLNNFSIKFSLYSFFEDNSAMISYATTLHLTISCHRLCHEMPMPLTYCHFDLASDVQCFSHSHTQLYIHACTYIDSQHIYICAANAVKLPYIP